MVILEEDKLPNFLYLYCLWNPWASVEPSKRCSYGIESTDVSHLISTLKSVFRGSAVVCAKTFLEQSDDCDGYNLLVSGNGNQFSWLLTIYKSLGFFEGDLISHVNCLLKWHNNIAFVTMQLLSWLKWSDTTGTCNVRHCCWWHIRQVQKQI